MPDVLRRADVALFPNRCEGGTNLVAMEAAAVGVPVVLSANTGHLDVIRHLGRWVCWVSGVLGWAFVCVCCHDHDHRFPRSQRQRTH